MRYFFLLLIVALYGCKKDTYTDEYIKGHEYVRTFYVYSINQTGTPPNDYLTLISLDHRLGICNIHSNSPLAPRDLTKPNLEETDDLKLYQVADFKFVLGHQAELEEIYTKTRDWRWVYGRVEDYTIPHGYTFQRIVIVKEI